MNWNYWIRFSHRWLSLAFTAAVIVNLIALMQQQSAILSRLSATVLSLGGSDALEAQEELQKFSWSDGAGFLFISPERAETIVARPFSFAVLMTSSVPVKVPF